MPYQAGNRLPGERASKIAHLEVLNSPLVKKLVESFKNPEMPSECKNIAWEPLPEPADTLKEIFGVDGSYQTINSDKSPYSTICFVKTSIIKMDSLGLESLDKKSPHPLSLRKILKDSVAYHSTVFPLRNVWIPEIPNNYDAIRKIIFESIKDNSDQMQGEIMETFKWIIYEKWGEGIGQLNLFECPHCEEKEATSKFNEEIGKCNSCKKEVYVTDMLGFHISMGKDSDSAPEDIPSTYMTIHETLLLFTAIRHYWENERESISDCLFVKDGPLSIRAQYSKLVQPIRKFLAYARDQGYPIHIIGQEKSGAFFDHFQFIENNLHTGTAFIPNDHYIRKEIQQRPLNGSPYGMYTNYGAKIFVKIDDYHKMVLNIPTGEFNANPSTKDLIGYERIIATLPKIISNRHEGALLPIELAHSIASLSTYPSAKILKLFSESNKK